MNNYLIGIFISILLPASILAENARDLDEINPGDFVFIGYETGFLGKNRISYGYDPVIKFQLDKKHKKSKIRATLTKNESAKKVFIKIEVVEIETGELLVTASKELDLEKRFRRADKPKIFKKEAKFNLNIDYKATSLPFCCYRGEKYSLDVIKSNKNDFKDRGVLVSGLYPLFDWNVFVKI